MAAIPAAVWFGPKYLKVVSIALILIAAGRLVSVGRRLFRKVDVDLDASSSPRILYLRSFASDSRYSVVPPSLNPFRVLRTRGVTAEDKIYRAVKSFGPALCLARPGERMPPLGFPRIAVPEAAWQDSVRAYLQSADLVVMLAGGGRNLLWEAAETLQCAPPKLVLIHLPVHPLLLTKESAYQLMLFLTGVQIGLERLAPSPDPKDVFMSLFLYVGLDRRPQLLGRHEERPRTSWSLLGWGDERIADLLAPVRRDLEQISRART